MRRRGGFTTEEMVVALGMVALGVAIMLFAMRAVPGRARTASCNSNVQQMLLAAHQYMEDYDGRMPVVMVEDWASTDFMADLPAWRPAESAGGSVAPLLHPYVKNTQIYSCPEAPEREKPKPEDEIEGQPPDENWARSEDDSYSYQVDYLFNLSVRDDDPPTTIVAGDNEPGRHNGTWNAGRLDGAVVRRPADEWSAQWPRQYEDCTDGEMTGDARP